METSCCPKFGNFLLILLFLLGLVGGQIIASQQKDIMMTDYPQGNQSEDYESQSELSTEFDDDDFDPEILLRYKQSYDTYCSYYQRRLTGYGEYTYRKLIYTRNLKYINDFNQNKQRKFNMGINDFTDLSPQEFRRNYVKLLPEKAQYDQIKSRSLQIISTPKQSINWQCYAGQVDNQGICGSCYAFVASNVVQTLQRIYKNKYSPKLSVQELISCSKPALEDGCQGGLFETVFEYIKLQGITNSMVYPYNSAFKVKAPACDQQKKNNKLNKYKINSYQRVARNCQSVISSLERGPLAAGINSYGLQFYFNGVFSGSTQTITDHAVMIVGYESTKGFKIKNIWGKTWGILGYGWVSETQHAGLCSRVISAEIQSQNKKYERCI